MVCRSLSSLVWYAFWYQKSQVCNVRGYGPSKTMTSAYYFGL